MTKQVDCRWSPWLRPLTCKCTVTDADWTISYYGNKSRPMKPVNIALFMNAEGQKGSPVLGSLITVLTWKDGLMIFSFNIGVPESREISRLAVCVYGTEM